MTNLSELSPETLSPVLSVVYNLPGPVTCTWMSSGLNAVFRVMVGDEAAVMKVYRAGWRTRADVLEEIAVLFHLDSKGVRVALPIARRDGAFVWSVSVTDCERQAVLFTHTRGQEFDAPDEACYRLFGQALADLHNATDDYTRAPVRYSRQDLLAVPMRHIDLALENRRDERGYVRAVAQRVHAKMDRLSRHELDWGYCHGDFRPANLHLDEATRAVTLFDFELGGSGFRAYDLAYMRTNLHQLALERLWDCPPLENCERCWNGFLLGYSERRPIHAVELEAVPVFVALRTIYLMGFLLTTAQQPGNEDYWLRSGPYDMAGGAVFERALRFLREWDEQYLGRR